MSGNDDKGNTKDKDRDYDPSRRRFVKNTGMLIGGIAGGSVLGGLLTRKTQTNDGTEGSQEVAKQETFSEARMFFTRYEDFAVLAQATERIYPKDDNGPGAIELKVPYFIDKQLASSWGTNYRDYRHGPYLDSEPTADQSSLTRGEIFISGIRKMNQLSTDRFDSVFDEIEAGQQIEILQDFHDGKVKMKGIGSDSFFTLLQETTLEGVYADPMYGGNRNMEGWKMKEFPGSVPSYADIIEKKEFVKMDPVSLTNYQQK